MEKSSVGSKFAACMWIYTKEALTGGQILDREQEEYPRKRTMSIILCTNWVFAGTFVDHEWVVVKDNFPAGGGHSKHGTGFQNRCSVRGTMEPTVVLSAHELESHLGK